MPDRNPTPLLPESRTRPPMAKADSFCGVLFTSVESENYMGDNSPPDFFADLHLDQVVAAIVSGREQYELTPVFYHPLSSLEGVSYRLDVLQDLEDDDLVDGIASFSREMERMRAAHTNREKRYYKHEQQSSFLDAVEAYLAGIEGLFQTLTNSPLRSAGLHGFREVLASYVQSSVFRLLVADTRALREQLNAIRYTVEISGNRVAVRKYASEPDYSAEVVQIFARFSREAPKQYRFDAGKAEEMNHIEAAIADMVAKLHPETFAFLQEYCSIHTGYCHPGISKFDKEIQFYVAIREYARKFKAVGLSMCYPAVSEHSKEVYAIEAFDIALATKLSRDRCSVVTNDFYLSGVERIFVVSGPNQGGKTTFARTFGQMYYLASIGCLVPGREARLLLCDRIFTHFEREDDLRDLQGKLEYELRRMHTVLDSATERSILIMNESFLSTTVHDALLLSTKILKRVLSLDMLCVSVTFLGEISTMSRKIVSMVSCVEPSDPEVRTYKIVRDAPASHAYAMALAKKHRLTCEAVRSRIANNLRGVEPR